MSLAPRFSLAHKWHMPQIRRPQASIRKNSLALSVHPSVHPSTNIADSHLGPCLIMPATEHPYNLFASAGWSRHGRKRIPLEQWLGNRSLTCCTWRILFHIAQGPGDGLMGFGEQNDT